MVSVIIFMAILLSGSLFMAICPLKKISFGNSISITCMLLICVLFVGGVLGKLEIAFYLILVTASVLLIFSVFYLVKNKETNALFEFFFTPAFLLFSLCVFYFLYCDIGLCAGGSVDEFSHWALVVKEMVRLNDFGTNINSIAKFKSYPPGMSLFQYLFEKIYILSKGNSGFSDWRLYFAYHVLLLALMMPFVDKLKKKQIAISSSLVVSLIILPTFFFHAWRQLLVDFALGSITGMALARIYTERCKDKIYLCYECLCCAILVLMKDAGLGLALFVATAYMFDMIINRRMKGYSKKEYALSITCIVFSIMIPKGLWSIVVNKSGALIELSKAPTLKPIISVIFGRDQSFHAQIVSNFIEALFTKKIYINYLSSYSPPELNISYAKLLVILLFLLYIVICLRTKYITKDGGGKFWLVFIPVFYLIYNLGVCATYVSNFGENGGLQLVDYDRYTGVTYLVMSYFVIIALYDLLGMRERDTNKIVSIAIVVCLLLNAPDGYFYWQFSRKYVEDSNIRRNIYSVLADIINDNCTEDDRICFVYQGGWNYPYKYLQYLIDSDALGRIDDFYFTEKAGGRYIAEDTINKIHEELLEQYDYVAIYKTDEKFVNDYGALFTDISHIQPNSIYKINKENGLLELVQ